MTSGKTILLGIALSFSSAFLSFPAAVAQEKDPAFAFKDKEGAKKPDASTFKLVGKAGLIISSGNSRTVSVSPNLLASWDWSWNRLSFDGGIAYVRASLREAMDADENGTIEANEISRKSETTTNAWSSKLRYDRFLTENNALYVAGQVGGDPPAGKQLTGGAQAGYSRQLFKTERHLLLVELGYDFSHESYVAEDVEGLSIHSIRFFPGYTIKLSKDTSAYTNVEVFANLNKETAPKEDGSMEVKTFEDLRVYWKLGLSTVLLKNISFGFDYTLKFDNVPAPLPPFKIPFAPGFIPVSEKLDHMVQASLIVNFI